MTFVLRLRLLYIGDFGKYIFRQLQITQWGKGIFPVQLVRRLLHISPMSNIPAPGTLMEGR